MWLEKRNGLPAGGEPVNREELVGPVRPQMIERARETATGWKKWDPQAAQASDPGAGGAAQLRHRREQHRPRRIRPIGSSHQGAARAGRSRNRADKAAVARTDGAVAGVAVAAGEDRKPRLAG